MELQAGEIVSLTPFLFLFVRILKGTEAFSANPPPYGREQLEPVLCTMGKMFLEAQREVSLSLIHI